MYVCITEGLIEQSSCMTKKLGPAAVHECGDQSDPKACYQDGKLCSDGRTSEREEGGGGGDMARDVTGKPLAFASNGG